MLKRVRQLHISLAAKCQLLFGAAVVLIIAAALGVPGHRMEQLTEQLNERSARTLIDYAVAQHVSRPRAALLPTSRGAVMVQPATTAPLNREGEEFTPPRLILSGEGLDESSLTLFEKRAIHRLRERDRESIGALYDLEDGSRVYRFARIESSCSKCHVSAESRVIPAMVRPTTRAATAPAKL